MMVDYVIRGEVSEHDVRLQGGEHESEREREEGGDFHGEKAGRADADDVAIRSLQRRGAGSEIAGPVFFHEKDFKNFPACRGPGWQVGGL